MAARSNGNRWAAAALLVAGAAIAAVVLASYGVGQADPAPHRAMLPARDAVRPGMSRVLFAGTSLTARGDWPGILAGKLAESGCPAVVERLAKPGANSVWGEAALAKRLAAGVPPTVVVIEFTGNDASLWRGMPLSESRARHTRMIAAVREAGAVPVLLTISPAFGRKALERLGADAYFAMYAELAAATGAGWLDTTSGFRNLDREARARLIPDGLHPTPEAMATLLVPALTKALLPLTCAQAVLPPSTVSTRPVTAAPSGPRK